MLPPYGSQLCVCVCVYFHCVLLVGNADISLVGGQRWGWEGEFAQNPCPP